MPTNYPGPYGMYSNVVHNGVFDAAPPSHTFSPLTLRELGIDPNSQQYRDLSTPSPNGYAPGVSSAPSGPPGVSGLGPVGDYFNGTGPNPSNPVIQTKPMRIDGPNYTQTDPAVDPGFESGGNIGGASNPNPGPHMDLFSILAQLNHLINANGQINKGPNGGINSTTQPTSPMPSGWHLLDQYGQPTQNKDPNYDPRTQTNQDYPYDPNQVRAMNPSATAGDTSPYDTGSGPFSLRSFAMGNRPGMRSPMGMTGGRFQRQTPGGYQGY